jgi:DMSO/TMAO reductase YedYZ molybdopterin-dependent catalytic subunit
MKKMRKQTVGIVIAVLLLVFAVAILAYLNVGDLQRKRELGTNAEFVLIHGQTEQRVTMEDLQALNPVDFMAVIRTSTTAGSTTVTFTGVQLSALLEKYGVNVRAGSTIEVKALDGYSSALRGEEVLEEENVYIAIAMNGEPLKPKAEGGLGPYYLVMPNTEFAQRWVKFMEEIVVR